MEVIVAVHYNNSVVFTESGCQVLAKNILSKMQHLAGILWSTHISLWYDFAETRCIIDQVPLELLPLVLSANSLRSTYIYAS